MNSAPNHANGQPPGLVMRAMTEADITEVAQLDKLSFSTPWSARTYRFELQNERSFLLVLERENVPPPTEEQPRGLAGLWHRLTHAPTRPPDALLGYGGMWTVADESHISTIAVHPAWRGHKLGELLLWAMVRQAVREGSAQVSLEVRVGNEVAQRLYRKYGFEVVGVRKGYYQDNLEDAYVMITPRIEQPYLARLTEMGHALQARLHVRDHLPKPAGAPR